MKARFNQKPTPMPLTDSPVGTDVKVDESESLTDHDRAPGYATDAFTLYLREIGQTKLLTPEEEIVLAKRIKQGDRKARELMIKANLRLVVKIARDYQNSGLPILDLISEGNIGLMKAVDRFDPVKGAKLSTYASWWIKQHMKRALTNLSKTIRLPVHVVDKLWNIRRAQSQLWMVNGREPTDQELSQEVHISPRRIGAYRNASTAPSSLDAMIGDDDSHSFAEIIPDEKTHTPYQELEHQTNVNMVRQMISGLDSRERGILEARFGIEDNDVQTLDEVGKKFGVTRERIRQIQVVAMAKLRRKIEELDSIQHMTA